MHLTGECVLDLTRVYLEPAVLQVECVAWTYVTLTSIDSIAVIISIEYECRNDLVCCLSSMYQVLN